MCDPHRTRTCNQGIKSPMYFRTYLYGQKHQRQPRDSVPLKRVFVTAKLYFNQHFCQLFFIGGRLVNQFRILFIWSISFSHQIKSSSSFAFTIGSVAVPLIGIAIMTSLISDSSESITSATTLPLACSSLAIKWIFSYSPVHFFGAISVLYKRISITTIFNL